MPFAGFRAHAHVERIVIDGTETSAASADAVSHTTLRGRAFGELDPDEAQNRIIQDIQLAPRNARGRVEYVADFTLSYPTQHTANPGVLLFDAANRGTPLADLGFGVQRPDGTIGGFFAQQGLIVLRSGWQADAPRASVRFYGVELQRVGLDVPVAKLPDGGSIRGPVRAEIIVNERTSTASLGGAFAQGHKTYAPVSLDDPSAVLTSRRRERDKREVIARERWRFADCSTVPFPGVPSASQLCLKEGLDPDRIYELVYTAKEPLVLGIGFAATRDIVSFFRYADADAAGTANPVRGRVGYSVGLGVSQSGNFMKTLVHLGFNRDSAGRRVFDGVMPVVASRTNALNIRFGQPGRGAGQHEDHLYRGHNAPSSWTASDDAVAGRRSGLLDRCSATDSCPRVVQVLTASEYWQLQGSPTHVDATGKVDLPLPPNVRLYFIASTQHSPALKPARGICTQLNNPAPTRESMRALFIALLQWVRDGKEPPPSVYPTLRARQLVRPAQLAWPSIPSVKYQALANAMPVLDFGPGFRAVDESGIISVEPPIERGEYTILVPQVDSDGNDLGGIRTTTTAVPLGTYTGWNYRSEGFAAGELCSLNGGYIPFHRTRAERLAAGDSRPSLEERYRDHRGYVVAVRDAAARLVASRLLLPEDAQRLMQEAEASGVLR